MLKEVTWPTFKFLQIFHFFATFEAGNFKFGALTLYEEYYLQLQKQVKEA